MSRYDIEGPGFYTPMDIAPGESPESYSTSEPPQDTSLDDILEDVWMSGHLESGDKVLNKKLFKKYKTVTVEIAKENILAWHKAEVANLLQVIEDELDKDAAIQYRDEEDKFTEGWRQSEAYVRAIVKKIKERLHE